MCEMCEAATELFEEKPIEGWFLVRASRNGEYMFKGDLGLVHVNSPLIFWQPDEFARKKFDVGYDRGWNKKWKEVRRLVLKNGIGFKKFASVPKDEAFGEFLAKELTEWSDGKKCFKDEDPGPISAVNMDAALVKPVIVAK